MSDVFDQAQERDAINLEASLAFQLGKSASVEAKPTGECLHCFEDIAAAATNKRFCTVDCRDGFDARLKARH